MESRNLSLWLLIINNLEFRTKLNQEYKAFKILKLVDHPVWPWKQKYILYVIW